MVCPAFVIAQGVVAVCERSRRRTQASQTRRGRCLHTIRRIRPCARAMPRRSAAMHRALGTRPRASCLPRRRQALDGTCGRRLSSSLPLLLVVRRTVHALCPPHRWPRGAPASSDSPRGVVACLASYVASAILAFNRLQTSMKTERGTAQLTAAVQACPTKQQATPATPPGPSDATVPFRVLILFIASGMR